MARIGHQLWLVAAGDTWATIATHVGIPRNSLVLANNELVSTSVQPKVGRVLLLPLATP